MILFTSIFVLLKLIHIALDKFVQHRTTNTLKMFYKWVFLFICTLPAYSLEYSQTENALSKLKEAKISNFKLRLHKKLEEVNRLRRGVMEGSWKLVPSISSHLVDFESKETVSKGCIARVDGSDIIFVVTSKNVLSILQNATFVSIQRFRSYLDFLSLQAVENRNAVWLISQQTSKKKRHFVDMYEFDNQTLRLGQRIAVPSPSIISTTKFGQELYIAIVSKGDIFHDFRLYQLKGTQLDEIYWTQMEITCSGLAIWNIAGIVYVALSFSNIGKLQIRQFREDSEEMTSIQLLDVYAYVIKSFEDDHSHYLVCGTYNSLVIYWWTGYTFQPLHSKSFDKKVVDIAIHRFAGRLFIAVIFQHEVEFLVQDSSAQYVAAGNQSFGPSTTLKSVLLWKSGASLYMLPLFEEKYLASMYEIRLKFEVSDPEKELLLDGCMNLLEDQMNKREKQINEISSKMENVWSSSTTYQVPSMTVKGKVKSRRNSSISSLKLGTKVSSIVALEEVNVKLLNCVLDRKNEFTKLVLKSTEQHIQSNLRFTNLNVRYGKVSELLNHANINEVATSRLHYALRKTGKQIVASNMTVGSATCGTLITGLLNGNKMEDFVLLRPGYWNMTGDVTFESLKSSEVLVKSINGVDIKNIVLTSNTQNIWDRKSFEIFTANSILLSKENGGESNFSKIKEMAYWRSKNFSGQNFSFTPTLNIEGNLNLSLLNGKEIDHLYSNSVKRNVQGNIHGLKAFKSVVIKGNVNILERINSFNLTNLMTVNTDQYITGVITFSNTTHSQDIFTDSLNGIDLSSKVVFRSRLNTEIKGIKTFQENLNVYNITMAEECRIDFFDPSTEFSEIMFHVKENDIFGRTHWFRKGVTVKNIEAINLDVNSNFPYLKGLQNVWLKTTEQTVPRLDVKNIKVKTLNVSKVNGIAVKDLVTVNEEDCINAPIIFTGDVSIKKLTPKKGANVNYPPGFWNPDVKVYISGNVTIEDPVLEGDLTVRGAINNIEMNFMHAKTMQTVKGEIHFEEIKLNELSSMNLNADLLNGINITEYYQRSVLLSKNIPIINKNFTLLKGGEMKCYGTLNKVNIDRVVTTNTNQTLYSSYKFQKSLNFKKVNVKKFFGTLQLENVIYKDSVRKISNKYFHGTVNTSDLTTSGNINGVNITRLKLEAFNKSDNNNVEEKLTILKNLVAKEIQIANNTSIDNVYVENLIRLDKSMNLGNFYAPSIKAKNVRVIGKVNGCSLNSGYLNMLSLKKGNQNISSKVHAKFLKIYGNLTVNYLNGASIPDWLIFIDEMATPEMHTSVILENVETDSIYILNTVNGISVKFLLQDYVQKNDPTQLIAGKKVFQYIDAKTVKANVLISNKTCGLDLSEMYKCAVSRSFRNETTLHSNLTLAGLEAKRLTVDGKLNGLKFPEDVVLTNTSEVIEGEVSFSSLNASVGLKVNGRIGDYQLENFLEKRVTLNAYEEISSELIFEDDCFIKDRCSIKGAINQINLEDLVNKFKNQTIAGTKNLTQEFTVMGDVMISGTINHLSLSQLQNNLFLYDRDETLKDVVNFSNLNASSLTCDTLNGVQIVNAYSNFHTLVHDINDKLDNITADIQSHQELLRKQSDSVEDPLSLYSFFELHAVLNYGLIERFLPVYEYGTFGPKYDLQVTQMIMWIKDDDPCRKTKSLIADVTKDGTFNLTNKMKGKVFPFTLSAEKDNVVGFYVQAERSGRCAGKKRRINVITLYASGETKKKRIIMPVNATVLDVQLLEYMDIFLIMSYSNTGPSETIFVYQYDIGNGTWTMHQKFHFQDMTSLSIISLGRDIDLLHDTKSVYLSVTGRTNPGITIYEWDLSFDEFVLETNISTSVSSYATWVVNDRTFYLLLAKEMDKVWKGNNTKVDIFTEPLEVYTLDEELQLNHTVNIKGVNSLEIFGLADESFVLASSNHFDTVYVLQFRGYNGFELIQEIPAPSVTETRVFTVDNNLFVAINSRKGPSKILKASIRGGRHLMD